MSGNVNIGGKTLKVYLYLLRHGPCELRDVQRGLEFSSASLASYHLAKLLESGLACQDEYGRYYAVKDELHKVLEGYLKVGPAVVPQLFFFSLFFTILVAFFSAAVLCGLNFVPHLIFVSFSMVAVLWFETVRLWRRLAV